MNAAHVSIEAAQFTKYTTALFTEERLSSFSLRVHPLEQPNHIILTRTQVRFTYE